jgi:hypothetical protein
MFGEERLPSIGNPIDEVCDVGWRLVVVRQRHVEWLAKLIEEHVCRDVWELWL